MSVLLASKEIVWDGVVTEDYVSVPMSEDSPIKIAVDNSGGSELTLTFEEQVESGEWYKWYGGDGQLVSIVIAADSKAVYGPLYGFSKFISGRIKLSADSAPGADTRTKVKVLGF